MVAAPFIAAAAAFNLVCSGSDMTGEPGSLAFKDRKSFAATLRVDLGSRRWCRDENCDETMPIERVTPTEIVFIEISRTELRPYMKEAVNRESGSYITMFAGSILNTRIGTCKPAPFTGFPSRKF